MAMGKREGEQEDLFVTHQQLRSQSHPFYRAVNRVLGEQGFDRYVERLCAKFYAKKMGRPGLAPGIYFRSLLLGFFEGIDSERGIAWRAADSLSLRDFLGVPASKLTPDHSTISRTRRLIDLETHQAVFTWVLGVLDGAGLIKGKTIGVDATTLEANAAMRSIVRRDDGRAYRRFSRTWPGLRGLRRRRARTWRVWIGSERRRGRTTTGSTPMIRTRRSRR